MVVQRTLRWFLDEDRKSAWIASEPRRTERVASYHVDPTGAVVTCRIQNAAGRSAVPVLGHAAAAHRGGAVRM
jgi:hypothetical protein